MYHFIRSTCFSALIILSSLATSAQTNPTDLDKSPLDMSYFPASYPILKIQGKTTSAPIARLIYSRPQKKGRVIFGGEVKYNEVWRLGANEATEIEFYKNVKINDKKIAKGRYTLYCIPTETQWTIIFLNKELDSWGAFFYNSKRDVVRIDLPIQNQTDSVEALTMYFETSTNGANLIMLWDNVKTVLPISI